MALAMILAALGSRPAIFLVLTLVLTNVGSDGD